MVCFPEPEGYADRVVSAPRRSRSGSRWRPLLVLVLGGAGSACAAETHVNLLDGCVTPGEACGEGLICDAALVCVERDAGGGVTGNPGSGGMVELPDGGLNALLDGACVAWDSTPQPLPTSLMLVVDVSGSMAEPVDGDSDRSRWDITYEALTDALGALPRSTAVGMLLFPNRLTPDNNTVPQPADECIEVNELVPIEPLGTDHSSQRELLEDALRWVDVVAGTPTHDAYVVARSELERSATAGSRHILLITDGQPTYSLGCVGTGADAVPDWPIVEEIAVAYAAGTSTFVIGAPGSEQTEDVGGDARPWLSRAASAGGTAKADCSHAGPTFCHFDMVDEPSFADALERALAQISGEIVPCVYDLPRPPDGQALDPTAVNVVWSSDGNSDKLLLRNDAQDCLEGWRYVEDGRRIEVCPESCQRVQAASSSEVVLVFGCTTEAVIY